VSAGPRLFDLLPAHHRAEDARRGGHALEALLAVVQDEIDRLEGDVERLSDDWFVETCQEWVVPYLGDLLGVRGLGTARGAFSQRAFVANTMRYRRRKGTAGVLEQLAADLTGWPARAVEFFERLAASQHLNHVRLHAPATALLRRAEPLERVGGPFEETPRTAELRRIENGRGRWNIPHVGLFLWRLREYPLAGVTARPAPAPDAARRGHVFTFSPLGIDAPLFNVPGTGEREGPVGEEDVPAPLRRRPLHDELAARRAAAGGPFRGRWFGATAGLPDAAAPVLEVWVTGEAAPRPPEALCICDLGAWRLPAKGCVAVDPVRGRLAFPANETPAGVEVAWAYGFAGDLGGGPYPRARADEAPRVVFRVPLYYGTPAAALAAWNPAVYPRAAIEIGDSRSYDGDLDVGLGGAGADLVVRAAEGQRPVLFGDLRVTGSGASRVALEGVLLAGTVSVSGGLEALELSHCTLVPGRRLRADATPETPGAASVWADDACVRLVTTVERCITGPLRLPPDAPEVRVRDSIVEGGISPRALLGIEVEPAAGWTGRFGSIPARLEAAVRAAFRDARVLVAGDRLLVTSALPGAGTRDALFRRVQAALGALGEPLRAIPIPWRVLAGERLRGFGVSAARLRLQVVVDGANPIEIELRPRPATLADAAAALQAAIRGAQGGLPSYTAALVPTDGERLYFGSRGAQLLELLAAPGDAATVAELGFGAPAAGAAGRDVPALSGPPATLERCTFLGTVEVRELTLASDCLFTAPALAVRRQSGCVRYSWLAAGSRVPRPYRCQPELAVREALAAEEPAAGRLAAANRARLRRWVEGRVRPEFVSLRYGSPAYGQLDAGCASEVAEGASDGNEMGAFNFLQAAWRLARFRESLDEYLRFGLEAGVFFVT